MMTTKSRKTRRHAARSRRGCALAFSLTCFVALAGITASSASASTATVSGGVLTYQAVAGETNDVTISLNGADHRINDTGATITAGAGCSTVDANTVDCSSVTAIVVNADDMGDTVTVSVSTPSTLNGELGADSLAGGAGNDTLNGGPSGDVLAGATGTDTVDYSSESSPVSIDLSTGLQSNGDILGDIENVIGGSGADTLTGSSAANTLTGNAGDDTLNGGAGDDTLDGGGGGDVLNGGAGTGDAASYVPRSAAVTADLDGVADDGEVDENDNIQPDVETIWGGAGNDTLTGNTGANTLVGMAGNDTLDGGMGADILYGTTGTDTVNYSSRSAAVTADIDGVADDGEAGEYDNVQTDVENLTGGSGGDTLTGSSSANTLTGGSGNDTLDGGAGADTLNGGTGTDLVDYSSRSAAVTADIDGVADDGESGENDNVEADVENLTGGSAGDTLTGNAGANILSGNGGNDTLSGGAGPDTFSGGPGADTIQSRDGTTDSVSCGADLDSVVADTLDTIQGNCEQVDRGTTGGGPGGGDPGGGDPGGDDGPPIKIVRRSVRMTRSGVLRLRVKCLNSEQRCAGKLRLRTKRRVRLASGKKARKLTFGRRSFSIPAGRTRTVRMKLRSRNRRVVKRVKRLSVRAVASITGRKTVRKTFKVKAPKRKRSSRKR